jgi:branched-chain amino acid transport system ATP-binding protein
VSDERPVADDGGAPALELRGVTAGYGRATVLRQIDLEIARGSIVALLGSNGAGKTTLLSTAAGLIEPSEGSVLIDGVDQRGTRPHGRARAGLCLVQGGRGVFPDLTVRENLELLTPPWKTSSQSELAIEAFPILGKRLGQAAGSLSGGEQQMLACARCYIADPTIVLLDEVSTGLAPKIIDAVFESLLRLAATGTALLIVEQYVERALAMAGHAYLLQRGEITFSGPTSELNRDTVVGGYLGVAPRVNR